MEFVPERSHGSLKRSVRITDGPVMQHPNSGTGKRVRVSYVSATYSLREGGWAVDSWSALVMGGQVLRKDGSEGKEHWSGNVAYSWQKMPQYAWLTQLIDAMRPEGTVGLPFRLHSIENDDLDAPEGE